MDITLLQARNIVNSQIFGMKLPVATSYKFSKLLKILQSDMQLFEENRKKLIEDHHGVLSEDKMQFTFAPEDIKPFNDDVEALMASTVDIGRNFPVKLESLGPAIELTPADLFQLEPLFDVPEESTETVQ